MFTPGVPALGMLLLFALVPQSSRVETLRSIGGLPAHVAGRFEEIGACERSAAGDYLIFDRRAHMVYRVPASLDGPPKEVVGVGVEPGRLLNPSAFDLAPDRTFAIADTPFGRPRVQFFFETGTRLGGFALEGEAQATARKGSVFLNLIKSVRYTGKSLLVSQPASGALISEYATDGRPIRAFGALRPTGHEGDRELHLALNEGRIVVNPRGGFYFVFVGGTPLFRKYDAAGALLFERHIQGAELDEYVRNKPSTWLKRTQNELPLVLPAVRTAEADPDGNLWISLGVPFTYVYDPEGERQRTVQFVAAGVVSPDSFSFGSAGRLLVTPGCYAFDVNGGSPARKVAARGLTR
jgi:hypothetical protein